jgi:GTP cyclohydrolase II
MSCRCGIEHCSGCDAEAPLAELVAMRDGHSPQRCVKVTAEQLAALQERPHACPHRGEVLRLETCVGCCGQVRLKVFACRLHGECTLGDLPTVRRCDAGCPDHRALSPETTGSPSDVTGPFHGAECLPAA